MPQPGNNRPGRTAQHVVYLHVSADEWALMKGACQRQNHTMGWVTGRLLNDWAAGRIALDDAPRPARKAPRGR